MSRSGATRPPLQDPEGDSLGVLLGRSPRIEALRDQVRRLLERGVAPGRLPGVLCLGETGTGKGLLAAALHRGSTRRQGPFVSINCAAIPETLVEAELFGFERGTFTDAREAKPGLFEAGHHGTVFLDEVGSLPPALQGTLLTVLEERAVRRLGSTRTTPIDVWVIAATSEDLPAMVEDQRFRRDLYHRLAAIVLDLPPLRERTTDIVMLAEHFLARACTTYGLPPKRLTPDAQRALLGWSWPGNVRELANLMERTALLEDDTSIGAAQLGLGPTPATPPTAAVSPPHLRDSLDRFERSQLTAALEAAGGNLSRAAALLGIPRNTLRYRLKRGGLDLHGAGRTAGSAPPEAPVERAGPVADPPLPAVVTGGDGVQDPIAVLSIRLDGAPGPASIEQWIRSVVMDKVRAFGSVVEDIKPTGIVVAFGSDSLQDAATRAVHAAVAIQEAGRQRLPGDHVSAIVHVAPGRRDRGASEGLIPPAERSAVLAALEGLGHDVRPGSLLVTAEAARHVVSRLGLWEAPRSTEPAPPAPRVSTPSARRRPGLAVLPFRNLSGDAREEYLADGITADITGALARIAWLSVIASATTLPYKGRQAPASEVAGELGVRYLVTGSVQRTDSTLRVAAELVDGQDGTIVWADHQDGQMANIFEFQDRLTARVGATIEGWLHRVETRRALGKRPESLDAYDCILRFLHLVHRLSHDTFMAAGELLERARTLEPEYGAAYAWQAWWYLLKIGQGWSAHPEQEMQEAERVAETALVYEPDDPLALAICGHAASVLSRDYDKALSRFERSLAFNPNSAFAWGLSAVTLCYVGEPGAALARVTYSLQLSPLDPFRFYSFGAAAFATMLMGRYEEAVEWSSKCRHDNPRFSGNLRLLAACLAHLDRLEEAREVAREFMSIEGSFNLSSFRRRYALRDTAALEAHVADLKKAGLPDQEETAV